MDGLKGVEAVVSHLWGSVSHSAEFFVSGGAGGEGEVFECLG